MTSGKSTSGVPAERGGRKPGSDEMKQPEWALGLQRLYDSVVEEELPDSFKDLLSQLDSKD